MNQQFMQKVKAGSGRIRQNQAKIRPNKVSTTSAGNPQAGQEFLRAGRVLDFLPAGSAGREMGRAFFPRAGNVNVYRLY